MEIYDKGLGFPLRLGPDRGIAVVPIEDSVRGMLEQILFTIPGERVNRPTFGVGIQRYVFEPDSAMLAQRLRIDLDDNVYEFLGRDVHILEVNVYRAGEDDEQLHAQISFEIVGTVSGRQDLEVVVPTEGVG
jgi:phage baseplate assembly protein W